MKKVWDDLWPLLAGAGMGVLLAFMFSAVMLLVVLPWIWPDMAYARCIDIGGDIYCW